MENTHADRKGNERVGMDDWIGDRDDRRDRGHPIWCNR